MLLLFQAILRRFILLTHRFGGLLVPRHTRRFRRGCLRPFGRRQSRWRFLFFTCALVRSAFRDVRGAFGNFVSSVAWNEDGTAVVGGPLL